MTSDYFKYFDTFYSRLSDSLYSVMNLDFSVDTITPANLLNNEKFESIYTPVYLESEYGKDLKHSEGIFKHANGYYIYLCRHGSDLSSEFKIKIIYKIEQYEEIKIYINSLKKIKNGINSNRT